MKSKPIVVNPKKFSKEHNRDEGLRVCGDFMRLNKIAFPEFDTTGIPVITSLEGDIYGLYNPATKKVYVDTKKSRVPAVNPGHGGWFYTGSKSDLTVAGTLAHEVGHHVHYELDVKKINEGLARVARSEIRVSAYEPNIYECFAEAMRIFILNPNLLRCGRPKRFEFLTKEVGLKPLHNVPWKSVLRHAHKRIIRGVEGWILEGSS